MDGESCVRSKKVDHWATCNQVTFKYSAPHQKAWLVERHNALICSALQRAEVLVITESLCVSSITVLGLVEFMHKASVCISNHTFDLALLGRQPHFLPALGGGYYGDVDGTGHNGFARVREIAAIAIIQATAKQRLARGDKRNHVVAMERSEHQF